jgi:AcrR family transcriptional regulator
MSVGAAGDHPGEATSAPVAKEKILAAAAKVIAEQGLAGVRMAGIAKAAGVSTGLLHYHFDTKERLFAEVLVWSDKRSSVVDQEARRDDGRRPPERLAAYLDRCLPSDERLEQDWLLWQELSSLCLRHPQLEQVGVDLYDHLYDTAESIIDDGVASGDFQLPEGGSRMVAEAAIAMCDGLGTRVLSKGPDLTLAGARHILAAMVGVMLGHDGPLPMQGAESPVVQGTA